MESSLSRLRNLNEAQELADAHIELDGNAQVKNLVDTLFANFDGVPQAEYCLSFMEMVAILTQNIHAIRTRNCTEFKSSLKLMLPWIQIYDNDKYGKHLPYFTAVLDTLPATRMHSYRVVCLHSQ